MLLLMVNVHHFGVVVAVDMVQTEASNGLVDVVLHAALLRALDGLPLLFPQRNSF